MMRPTIDEYFLGLAYAAASRSTCRRLKVGAVVVDRRGRILGTGYNGSPAGYPHCEELDCDLSRPCQWSVHAETNALLFSENRELDKTIYVTAAPCRACALAIANAGVVRVVIGTSFRDEPGLSGREVLDRGHITVDQLDLPGGETLV
jgi:dCMP deaminase